MKTQELTRVDRGKNRIYIYFRGYLTLEQVLALKRAYREAIAKCTPGFTCLTYAEDFRPGSQEIQNVICEMKTMAAEAGLSKVARVVGAKPLGGMQIDYIAREKARYPARNFATEAEAEAYLDEQ